MDNFLSPDYEKPASNSNYKKFESGDNYFRILSPAITGWIDWKDEGDKRVPIRTKEELPPISQDPKKTPKHFWSFVIWCYAESKIMILEITQRSIQDAIFNLHNDKNWGNPALYDLNVKKTGEKMETRYAVMPAPPKDVDVVISETYKETPVNLNKLYENGDPFETEIKTEEVPM